MCEYSNADAAGVQRAIDFQQSIYDQGWVATHGSSPGFRQIDAMPTEGNYVWATASNMRGLFDPATGNQAVVPAMARVSKAKRLLVTFGVPKPYSSNPGAGDYDFYPCKVGSYDALGKFWVRVAQEAKNRGTPFHGVSHRQELKRQPNRSFGSGGGGQSEVDSYTAIYEAFRAWDPTIPVFGPHLALGGTQTLADRNRPLQWAWDKDFLVGWMSRVPGWDGVFLDYANTDMNAPDAAHGLGNPQLQATWVPNWLQICNDFWALGAPYFGPNKAKRLGFIEHYSLEVNLQHWNLYTDAQKASFQYATLMQLALGGAAEVFDWQPEGSADGSTFQDYFGLFNKTAVSPASADTGKPNAKGLAVKAFHDAVAPGSNIYPVNTGNQRVFGLATDDAVLLANLNDTTWSDSLDGKTVSVNPYGYTKVAVTTSTPPSTDTVTMSKKDIEAIRSDQNNILGSRASTKVKGWAQHTISLLPPP
jgi:hypothetical protein